jgi:hypothetical protein
MVIHNPTADAAAAVVPIGICGQIPVGFTPPESGIVPNQCG